MSARILDGKAIAAQVRAEVAAETRALGIVPGLCVIQVGENPASTTYVNSKERTAKEAGFHSVVERYPDSITERALLARIDELNRDPAIHGFFVQLPLPGHINAERIQRAVDPAKDVDGFHPVNQGLLLLGEPRLVPATPRGIVELLARAGISPAGKRVVVIGRSTIVGKPLAAAFLLKGSRGDATVTVAHSRTPDLPAVCREADILVAAIGQPRFVKAGWVKPGAVVVDVGTNRDENGKFCGDVDFDAVKEVAGAITSVPGGVGPMTIAMLMRNTLDAAKAQLGR
jgi:methylenetetrahydrofolate dehydrogenase (NADP+) / methenyltetrahydrofolate cyclohydrolase